MKTLQWCTHVGNKRNNGYFSSGGSSPTAIKKGCYSTLAVWNRLSTSANSGLRCGRFTDILLGYARICLRLIKLALLPAAVGAAIRLLVMLIVVDLAAGFFRRVISISTHGTELLADDEAIAITVWSWGWRFSLSSFLDFLSCSVHIVKF